MGHKNKKKRSIGYEQYMNIHICANTNFHDFNFPTPPPITNIRIRSYCFFANGFITCPYDGQKFIDSVLKLRFSEIANITVERLDIKFYVSTVTPILVRCI